MTRTPARSWNGNFFWGTGAPCGEGEPGTEVRAQLGSCSAGASSAAASAGRLRGHGHREHGRGTGGPACMARSCLGTSGHQFTGRCASHPRLALISLPASNTPGLLHALQFMQVHLAELLLMNTIAGGVCSFDKMYQSFQLPACCLRPDTSYHRACAASLPTAGNAPPNQRPACGRQDRLAATSASPTRAQARSAAAAALCRCSDLSFSQAYKGLKRCTHPPQAPAQSQPLPESTQARQANHCGWQPCQCRWAT